MAAGVYDLYIEQGATYSRVIYWKDDSNVAIDLTGYTARMQIRRTYGSTDTIWSGTNAGGEIVIDEALGKLTVTIPATSTAGFSFSSAVYDLELAAPSGQVTRLIQGSVELSKEVTR